jgi:glucose-6-phosphate isomerase
MITAKVRCCHKTESGEGENRTARVSFLPDYVDGRNAEWAAATPSLSLEMTLNNKAADLFKADTAYTLQFVEVIEA